MTQDHAAELYPQPKRRIWKAHIERWQQSGLSQVAYCREHRLTLHQFYYWKKKLVQPDTDISFVPLDLSQHLPVVVKATSLNLFTPSGYKIEVGQGFDPATLKQLINTVQSL